MESIGKLGHIAPIAKSPLDHARGYNRMKILMVVDKHSQGSSKPLKKLTYAHVRY